jgi:hypothetical protein
MQHETSGGEGTGPRDVRLRILLDDEVSLNVAASVTASAGGIEVESPVGIPAGTSVSLFALESGSDLERLGELKGNVVQSRAALLLEACGAGRFRMGLALDVSDAQAAALSRILGPNRN